MTEGINIAALSQRTAVPAHTLRKWEERYGVLAPIRTQGGQRRYREEDVARVEWLRDRIADGFRIGEAAALLGRRVAETPRTAESTQDALYDAFLRADPDALESLLDQTFAVYGLEEALATIIAPVLERVGQAWESGHGSVADEHLVTAGIRARIERLLADARGPVRGTAVLACAPEERHELGLLMLATLMRADGWKIAYLGADTPLADAVRFAERVSADLLCLSVGLGERIPLLTSALAEVDRPEGLELVLGGAAATAEVARRLGIRYLGADLRESVTALRELPE